MRSHPRDTHIHCPVTRVTRNQYERRGSNTHARAIAAGTAGVRTAANTQFKWPATCGNGSRGAAACTHPLTHTVTDTDKHTAAACVRHATRGNSASPYSGCVLALANAFFACAHPSHENLMSPPSHKAAILTLALGPCAIALRWNCPLISQESVCVCVCILMCSTNTPRGLFFICRSVCTCDSHLWVSCVHRLLYTLSVITVWPSVVVR